ncbi:MAG TPA: hypothetical protein VIU65_01185, partial [Pyrinomonadaceae bacterium]
IGHVGDSRLYRLSAAGELVRETEDHSIVEEEVRAGRMTPEQAANHPSKNVISRALGAEESVEVDMKTIDIEEGTSFLLCSDGITRHIPDQELRDLLRSGLALDAVCVEMKDRCYQRGAEDNLTAVVVQVGTPKFATFDVERTVDAHIPALARTRPDVMVEPQTVLTPPSRIAFPGPPPLPPSEAAVVAAPAAPSKRGHPVLRFLVFLLILAAIGGAFYGGTMYQKSLAGATTNANPAATPTPDNSRAAFESKRAAVDADPQKWLTDNLPVGSKPTDSKDPEFLYLYGRALMLTGNHRDAVPAFDMAIANLRAEPKTSLPLGAEIKMAQASAALKLRDDQKASLLLDEVVGVKREAAPK